MSDDLMPFETRLTPYADALDQNPAAVYLATLTSAQSRYTMENALRTLVAIFTNRDVAHVTREAMLGFPWARLSYQHTAYARARLAERYSPANANRIISALRGVLKETWRLGLMTAEAYQRAADVRHVRARTLIKGRDLQAEEIARLAEVCRGDDSPAGARDLAIIGMLYVCGLRRSELVNVCLEDYTPDSGQIRVLTGKGRKQRTVYIAGSAKRALDRWLAILPYDSGPIFHPVLKNGRIQPGGIVSQTVYDMLRRRAKQAGVKNFSPHDFRRTFVGDLLDRGVDIATVANMAGHSSVETTRRYDRRPETIRKEAAEKLHFPDDAPPTP